MALRFFFLLLLTWSSTGGWAQKAPVVTDADIERTRAQIKEQMEKLTDDNIDAVRRRVIEPQQRGENDQAIRAFRPQMPKLDAMPVAKTLPQVDIGALSGQVLKQMPGFSPAQLMPTPKLYVFVTMTMPKESLLALVEQAEKARATLVLRGMVENSLQKTGVAMRKLIGSRKVNFAIDPEAFDRFGITHAPSFVLTKVELSSAKACAEKLCAPASGYALISGDVSLSYALERIEQRAPAFKAEAQGFLKRMRG